MKNILLITGILLIALQTGLNAQTAQTPARPRCSMDKFEAVMIANDSAWKYRFTAAKAALQAHADYYTSQKVAKTAERTTSTTHPVPVIFHIAVDSAQFNLLGGTAGIITRCDSQIAVLNRDYNHENADSVQIPSSWKPLYGDAGIHFALARVSPTGAASPGYEIRIIPGSTLTDGGFADAYPNYGYYTSAKTESLGLAAWDNTKYYNVWCINYTDNAGLLGITTPLSWTGTGGDAAPADDEGVCILYNTLGCTAADGTPPPNTGGIAGWEVNGQETYNLGRTLSHETGHFFEIWHPWGDDNGLCPWGSSECGTGLGEDDGLGDTPPQSNCTYNSPTYTISGGTINDCCQLENTTNTQPIGIACLSFMDYTNDNAMHMFTNMQAAAMASMVLIPPTTTRGATGSGTIGENYSLTQNPDLTAAVPVVSNAAITFNVYPNPATGLVTVTVNSAQETVNQIAVINILGQEVMTIKGQNTDYYSIDLSGMSKGIYFIKCNFASGSITRKILLQ